MKDGCSSKVLIGKADSVDIRLDNLFTAYN